MEVLYSYGCVLFVVLKFIADAHCAEDPALPLDQITLPETTTPTMMPSIHLNSSPGWWIGPVQPNSPPEFTAEQENGTSSSGDQTNSTEIKFIPFIIIRDQPQGPPEIFFGSVQKENGSIYIEVGNVNDTVEADEFGDIDDLNVTEIPIIFPDEEIIEEETYAPLNGSMMSVDDFFLIEGNNVTEGAENKTAEIEAETAVIPPETTTSFTNTTLKDMEVTTVTPAPSTTSLEPEIIDPVAGL